MRITVPHRIDRATVRKKIEERLHQMLATYGHYLTEVEHRWEGDRLVFSQRLRDRGQAYSFQFFLQAVENSCSALGFVPIV
jgi:hypothetical protein